MANLRLDRGVEMADGIFRRKNGFTVVQNQIARDSNVSLKGKGLYLLIQSYITMPDKVWKKSDFEKYSTDGSKSFETAWNDLRDSGYLKWHRVYVKETGKFRDEFELLDEPKAGPYGFFYNKENEITKTKGEVVLRENVDNSETVSFEKSPQMQETSHHPHFGVDGKGGDGNHVDGNYMDGNHPDEKGGDNYKYYTDNNLDNNNFNISSHPVSSTSEVNSTASGNGQDETGQENSTPVIILDSTILIDECYEYNMKGLLKDRNGIPYQWVKHEEMMTQAIQVLAGWNYVIQYGLGGCGRDEENETIYVCMVKNLIEMCLTPGYIRVSDNRKISYAKVIDQINSIYHKDDMKEHPLKSFFVECVRRYKDATIKTKIQKVDDYCKSLMWNTFSTYEMDWNGFFNRTHHGNWRE